MSLRDTLMGKSAGIKQQAEAELAKEPVAQPAASAAPRTAIGQASVFQKALAEQQKEFQAALANNSAVEVSLNDLHEVEGRKRHLTAEQFSELKSNLDRNPLTTPITVRKRAIGGFEIIAGHNRIQAFKELGREKILAVVLDMSDDEADRSAFYSNLLAPSLPDFEKFHWLSARAKSKKMTHEQLADEAGISRQLVGFLLSFDKLPKESIAALNAAADKSILGAGAAQKLAAISIDGKQKKVSEAISKLIQGELTQAAAVAFANQSQDEKPKKPEPIVVRQGKKTYCSITRTQRDMRLSFSSEDTLTDELIERVQAVIAEYANRGN